VKERVFFLPATVISPPGCKNLPAVSALVERIRQTYEIDVYVHPWFQRAQGLPPDRRDHVKALRDSIGEGCHVLTMGTVAELAMMALDRRHGGPNVKSLVAAGMYPFSGTLRALDLEPMAIAMKAQSRFLTSYNNVRAMMQGATADETQAAVDDLDAAVDWDYWMRSEPSYSEFNLLADGPVVDAATLFLHSPLDPDHVMSQAFLRIVPDAEVGQLDVWPTRMQDADSGIELATKAMAFFDKQSGED
jgi:hypothetical protein